MKFVLLLAVFFTTVLGFSLQANEVDDPTFRDGAVVIINNGGSPDVDDPTFRDGAVVIDIEECGRLYSATFCDKIEILLR